MMKKFGACCLALFLALGAVQADGPAPQPSPAQKPFSEWTPIQFAFTMDFPSSTYNSNVYGLKTGWPISGGIGRVCGLEISWFVAATDYVRGLQAALFYSQCNQLQGVQAAIGSSIAKAGFLGLQSTLGYNYSDHFVGVQAGLVNTAANYGGIQAAGTVNVAANVGGIQAAPCVNIAEQVGGIQAGAYNQAQSVGGLQFGIVNLAKSKSFQIGLVNIIQDGWLPFCLLVNFQL